MDQKLLAKAKTAKSAQELSRMAHEAGVTLSDAEADSYYAELHQGDKELSDEELNNVAGGRCVSAETLASEYKSVLADATCSKFEWSYWFFASTDGYKAICKNCHYCSTSKDYGSFFCTLKPIS